VIQSIILGQCTCFRQTIQLFLYFLFYIKRQNI